MSVCAASLILLYAASTTYHTFDISEKGNTVLKDRPYDDLRPDSRSYTPVCLLVLEGRMRIILLAVVWTLALTGILIKAFGYFVRNGFLPFLYRNGWMCPCICTDFPQYALLAAFGWLLAGGIIYTVGGIIYALKVPISITNIKLRKPRDLPLFVMAEASATSL